jgi:hypothetical protein
MGMRMSEAVRASGKILGIGHYHGKIIRWNGTIEEFDDYNLVVNQGLNSILGVYLQAQTSIPAWFLGIFQGNYTPQATDTAANIAANSTECSSYNSATRPQWNPAAPSGQSITNSGNPATYTFNASVTIYGGFLVSSNVINGTAGVLFSEATFSSPKAVANLDQLVLTYTFTAASA